MAGPVDNYWHTFLLFTYEYEKFCKRVLGRFMHHAPDTGRRSNKKKKRNARRGPVEDTYENMIRRYREAFGSEPDKRAWPTAGD